MSLDPQIVQALADELEKIAEPPKVEEALKAKSKDLTTFRELLRPGDILFTAPDRKRIPLWARGVYKPISKLIQGTDYGHTAIYAGDGRIIDARMGRHVIESSLERLVGRNNVVAFRPKVGIEETKKAIEYASGKVGTPFSLRSLLRAATPIRGKRRGSSPESDDKFICSALIANAYSKRHFSKASRLYTRPAEILKSHLLKPIASIERFNREVA